MSRSLTLTYVGFIPTPITLSSLLYVLFDAIGLVVSVIPPLLLLLLLVLFLLLWLLLLLLL